LRCYATGHPRDAVAGGEALGGWFAVLCNRASTRRGCCGCFRLSCACCSTACGFFFSSLGQYVEHGRREACTSADNHCTILCQHISHGELWRKQKGTGRVLHAPQLQSLRLIRDFVVRVDHVPEFTDQIEQSTCGNSLRHRQVKRLHHGLQRKVNANGHAVFVVSVDGPQRLGLRIPEGEGRCQLRRVPLHW